MKWITNLFKPRMAKHIKLTNTPDMSKIPEKWMVLDLGQSPVHGLWFCHMIHWDDLMDYKKEVKRQVWCEEIDTMEEAIQFCVDKIAEIETNAQNKII